MIRLFLNVTALGVALVVAAHADSVPRTRNIICRSGGTISYEGTSDPAYPVYLGSADDHVLFVDAKDHRWTRVGGNCIIKWDRD